MSPGWPARSRASLLLIALLPACRVGVSAARFEPARTPQGIAIEAKLEGGRLVAGELLEVREDSLLVLANSPQGAEAPQGEPRLLRVPFAAIRSARFAQAGDLDLPDRQPPAPPMRKRLVLLSRFPQGLSPELLAKLLEAHAQAEVDELAP
jgi:hypothetical protein